MRKLAMALLFGTLIVLTGSSSEKVESFPCGGTAPSGNAETAEKLCKIYVAGNLDPEGMDTLLRKKKSLFTKSIMKFVQKQKQKLGVLSESHRQGCYMLPKERRTDCLVQNPAALMAMWLQSLEKAVGGELWYNTLYGRWDIDLARRWGTSQRSRMSGIAKGLCKEALSK